MKRIALIFGVLVAVSFCPEAGRAQTLQGLQSQINTLASNLGTVDTVVGDLHSQVNSAGAQSAFLLGKYMTADSKGDIGVNTSDPLRFFSLEGSMPRNLGMDHS
jgi:hypothetical protein